MIGRTCRWAASALALLTATPAAAEGGARTRYDETPAAEQPGEAQVPPWAASWKDIWLQARKNGALQLSARASSSTVAPGPSELFAVVDVQALEFPPSPPSPLNLAIVIDSSASMRGPQLLAVRRVAREVISRLATADRIALILTSNEAETIPATLATAQNRERLLAFIDGLKPAGSTDLSVGFTAAVEQVRAVRESFAANRILLISDGRLNHGMDDPAGIAQMAKQLRESEHIHVSTVSIGEDADRELMEGIAREGWGFTEYVSDGSREPRMGRRLKEELSRRAAERVELTFKPAKGVSVEDVFEHDELRAGDELRVPLYELAHGERQRVVFRLKLDAPGTPGPLALGTVELAWRDALTDGERSARVPLSARVEPGAGSSGAEPELVRIGLHDLAERNLVWAEGTFEDGNLPEGLRLLDSTKALLLRGRALVGPDAFADELARVEQLRERHAPQKSAPARSTHKRKRRKG